MKSQVKRKVEKSLIQTPPEKQGIHYILGGSVASFWTKCTGYVELSRDLPPLIPTAAMKKGSKIHLACLNWKAQAEILYLHKGKKVPPIPKDLKRHEEYAEEFWDTIYNDVLDGSIIGKQIFIEQLLTIRKEMGGSADFAVLAVDDKGQRYGDITDIKSGHYTIEPDADQLLLYATSLYAEVLRQVGFELDYVNVRIYQPTNEVALATHSYTKSKLAKTLAKYKKIGQEIDAGIFKYKYGDHCEFCPAKLKCDHFHKELEKEMLTDIVTITKRAKKKESPSLQTADKIAMIVKAERKLSSYVKEAKRLIFHSLLAGEEDFKKYFKLVKTKGKRKLIDDYEAIVAACKRAGINPFPKNRKFKTIGRLQQQGGVGLINKLTEPGNGSLILVSKSDPREAHVSSAELLDAYDDSDLED